MRTRVIHGVILLCGLLSTQSARAQEVPSGLGGLLLRFFSPSNPVVLQANPVPAFSHAAHFVSQPSAQATLTQLNRGIATQLSTFPLGSSSAAFTYTFDSTLGVYNRSTQSFGPIFAERPLTAGKGKFSVGVNHLRATYDQFEGQDLRNGALKLYLLHQDVNNDGSELNPWFEGDLIQSALSIRLENKTTALFANYGVTDRLDVGIAVPFVRLNLDARIQATIDHAATAPDPFVVHVFSNGTDSQEFRESGSADGVGDIVLRSKFNLVSRPSSSLAAAVDLRLPTGKEADLLGSGATQVKMYLIGARPSDVFSPRASFGYTFSSGGANFIGNLPNELNYSAGFDLVPHSRVTVTADLLGRTLFDTERLVIEERTFQFRFRTDPTVREITRSTPGSSTGNLNLLLGSAGIKINPVGRLLVVANLLFSIGDSGLQDKVTPVFGLDYTF
jgi:hypothetical protein